jgi:hypothetical protein
VRSNKLIGKRSLRQPAQSRDIKETVQELNKLTRDIRKNPDRYFRVKVFRWSILMDPRRVNER